MDISSADAARLLGMKPAEVVAVETINGDLVITTHDQFRTVVVADDHPDGAGRSGIMAYRLPDGFPDGAEFPGPVFTPRKADVTDDDQGPDDLDAALDADLDDDLDAALAAELDAALDEDDDDEDDEDDEVQVDPIAGMRKAELLAFAEQNDIDLDGASRVDEIRAAIHAALDLED
jgi:hypothetical protein